MEEKSLKEIINVDPVDWSEEHRIRNFLYKLRPELAEIVMSEGDYFHEPWQDYFIWGRRNPTFGNWLGYVSVPPSSPLAKRDLVREEDIDVHGGLTCQGLVKDLYAPDFVVYGFDCMHYMDKRPYDLLGDSEFAKHFEELHKEALDSLKDFEVYRTKSFCKQECLKLAEQLKALETKKTEMIKKDEHNNDA